MNKQLRRALDKQDIEGECVWNTMLRGVADLPGEHCMSHRNLLKRLQSRVSCLSVQNTVPVLFEDNPVQWNGAWLTGEEYVEARSAILGSTVTTRGYDCRACDPLLITMTAVFRLKIVHDMPKRMVYSTTSPRRTVYISSSHGHMFHDQNVDTEIQMTESKSEEVRVVKEDAACDVCGLIFPSGKNMLRHREKHKQPGG